MPEIGVTQLFIDLWVFGKPLMLVFIVFLFVRKTLGIGVLYLMMALLATYGIWYMSGWYLGSWVAESAVNVNHPQQPSELFYRLAAAQFAEVVAITLVAYGISKLSWVRK